MGPEEAVPTERVRVEFVVLLPELTLSVAQWVEDL